LIALLAKVASIEQETQLLVLRHIIELIKSNESMDSGLFVQVYREVVTQIHYDLQGFPWIMEHFSILLKVLRQCMRLPESDIDERFLANGIDSFLHLLDEVLLISPSVETDLGCVVPVALDLLGRLQHGKVEKRAPLESILFDFFAGVSQPRLGFRDECRQCFSIACHQLALLKNTDDLASTLLSFCHSWIKSGTFAALSDDESLVSELVGLLHVLTNKYLPLSESDCAFECEESFFFETFQGELSSRGLVVSLIESSIGWLLARDPKILVEYLDSAFQVRTKDCLMS
jgi:hypothetical protein